MMKILISIIIILCSLVTKVMASDCSMSEEKRHRIMAGVPYIVDRFDCNSKGSYIWNISNKSLRKKNLSKRRALRGIASVGEAFNRATFTLSPEFSFRKISAIDKSNSSNLSSFSPRTYGLNINFNYETEMLQFFTKGLIEKVNFESPRSFNLNNNATSLTSLSTGFFYGKRIRGGLSIDYRENVFLSVENNELSLSLVPTFIISPSLGGTLLKSSKWSLDSGLSYDYYMASKKNGVEAQAGSGVRVKLEAKRSFEKWQIFTSFGYRIRSQDTRDYEIAETTTGVNIGFSFSY